MSKNKVLSLLLSLVLLMSLLPSTAFATDEIQSSTCTHEHTSDCVLDEADVCTHAHDKSCGGLFTPKPLADGNEVLTLESSGEELHVVITKLAELEDAVLTQSFDVGEIESQEELALPTVFTGEDEEGAPLTIEGITWGCAEAKTLTGDVLENAIFDPLQEARYSFVPTLPEGYELAEGVCLPIITVVVQGTDEGSLETYAWEEFEYNGVMYYKENTDSGVVAYVAGWGAAGPQPTLTIPASVHYAGEVIPVTMISPAAFPTAEISALDLSAATNLKTIGMTAFAGCKELVSVSLPTSVSSIEESAFANCYKLTNLNLSAASGLTTIGKQAFFQCFVLKDVAIPSSVLNIDEEAFWSCYALTSLNLSGATKLAEIGNKAFQDCYALEKVTIPSSVTSIGDYAFEQCSVLSFLDLSKASNLSDIGDFAFYRTNISGQLVLPSSLTFIGASAFRDLKITGALTLPSGLKQIGVSAFQGTGISGALDLPPSLTNLGACAFQGTGISGTITIPSGVTTIENEVFAGLGGVDSIVLHDNIASIGARAFLGTGINGIFTLPSGLVSIGDGAFRGTGISGNLILPAGVTSIGASAFRGCTSLSSLVFLSTGSIAIGASAFRDSGIGGSLILPAGVTSIGDSAFSDTKINGTLIFPQSLTLVEGFAFSNTQLTSADLRAFKGTLGERVFYGSSSLTSLWFAANPAPAYKASTFSNMSNTGTVYYPSGATGYTSSEFAEGELSGWTFTPYSSEARTFTAAQVGGVSETATSTHIEITFDSAVAEDSLTASHIRILNGTSTVGVGAPIRINDTTWRVALNSITRNGDITVAITNFSSYIVNTPPQTVAVYRKITEPSVPQNLSIVTADKYLRLNWSAPTDDGGVDITGYEVSSDGKTWTEASNSTRHIFTGLTNNTEYTLWVRALNTKLTGAAASKVGKPIGSPGVPTGVTLTPGDGKLDISWTAPDDGGSEITKWEISVSDGEDNWETFPIPYVTKVTKHFLKNGTEYTVKIRAINILGTGDASDPQVGTPRTTPSVPQVLQVTPGDSKLEFSWDAPLDNGGAEITKYQISTNFGADWSDTATLTSHTLTRLRNGISYNVQLRAVNEAGPGAEAFIIATPSATVTTPTVPRSFTAVPASEQVTLSWLPPENNGGAAISKYEVSKDGGTSWSDAASSTSHTFDGLTNGTTYSFSVRAVNSKGAGAEDTIQATPAVVFTAPQKLTTTPGDGQIMLAWSTPSSNGGSAITGYEVSIDGTTWIDAASSSSHTFTELTNGVIYTLYVRALNSMGESEPASVKSKPLASPMVPQAPQNLMVTPGDAKLGLSWDPPASNNGSAIIKYQYSVSTGSDEWKDVPFDFITSISVPNLQNDTTYTVKVRAVNEKGVGLSINSSGTPTAGSVTVPEPPGDLHVIPSDGILNIDWKKPADGGSAITKYQISVTSDGSENWVDKEWTEAEILYENIRGLTNSALHTVKVRAVNAIGAGAVAVAYGTPVADVTTPDAPVNLAATPSDGALTLHWQTPSNGGSPITGYEILVVPSDSQDWELITSDPTTVSHTLSNLVNGTTYTIKLRAVNDKGDGQVAETTGTPKKPVPDLSFTYNSGFDIPASTVGVAITSINVSTGVQGGIAPYTFTAEGLPAGITISAEGLLSGTPTTAQAAGTATITVTDSVESTASITISYGDVSEPTKEPTPQATFDGATLLLTDVTADMRYSLDGGSTFNACNATAVDLSQATLSTTHGIRVVKPGNGTTTIDSDPQVITLTQAAAPIGVSKTDETATGKNDGTLTGVSTAMEYRLSTAGSWMAIADSVVSDLAPGTYEVRTKGGLGMLASAAVTLTIAAYKEPDPIYTPQTFTDGETGVVVKVNAVSGAKLVVKQGALHTEGSCAACDAIRKNPGMIALYDISIEGGYSGTIEISIPVPSSYNGKTVVVRHCQGSRVEEVTLTVQNGYATGTFTSLSPFAVFPVHATPSSGSATVPRTGDSSPLGVCVGLLAAALLVTGCARRQYIKRRGSDTPLSSE